MVKRRKSQAAPLPPDCPLRQCMRLFEGAWTADVIWHLAAGERCFSELRADLQGVSAKMLTTRLRQLEARGILTRATKPTSPPTVWYSLTPVGLDFAAALANLVSIAKQLRAA